MFRKSLNSCFFSRSFDRLPQKVQNCGRVCLVSWKFDIETVNELLVALHCQNPLPRTALKLGWLRFWGDSEKSELSAVEPRL